MIPVIIKGSDSLIVNNNNDCYYYYYYCITDCYDANVSSSPTGGAHLVGLSSEIAALMTEVRSILCFSRKYRTTSDDSSHACCKFPSSGDPAVQDFISISLVPEHRKKH